jgi:hypothetical protein
MVIRVISVGSVVSSNDKPPKGPSPGDRYITTSVLRNQVPQFGRPVGAVVGRDRAIYHFYASTTYLIDGVASFPGGTVFFRGRTSVSSTTGAVPVTGGTGRFARARGTVRVSDLGGTRALNIYRLRLP